MNQDKVVKVILKKKEDNDILEFKFEQEIELNLNNATNNDLKVLFQKIIEELSKEKFSLELEIEKDYNVDLYRDVCKDYIIALSEEINELTISKEWKEVFEIEAEN